MLMVASSNINPLYKLNFMWHLYFLLFSAMNWSAYSFRLSVKYRDAF